MQEINRDYIASQLYNKLVTNQTHSFTLPTLPPQYVSDIDQ